MGNSDDGPLATPSSKPEIYSNDPFFEPSRPESLISVQALIAILVGGIAVLLVLISFVLIWRQLLEKRRKRSQDMREEEEGRRMIEEQEKEMERKRMPEMWCQGGIPVETDGKAVGLGELGEREAMEMNGTRAIGELDAVIVGRGLGTNGKIGVVKVCELDGDEATKPVAPQLEQADPPGDVKANKR